MTTLLRRATRVLTVCSIAGVAVIACAGRAAPESKSAPASAPAAEPAAGDEMESTESAPSGAARAAPAAPLEQAQSSTKRHAGYDEDIDDIDALTRRLDGALRLSAPDCTTASSLRDRICDLAQRICDIAGRSAEPEVAERCTDGKQRCGRATASVRTTCPE
jgi:hypothetical protein